MHSEEGTLPCIIRVKNLTDAVGVLLPVTRENPGVVTEFL